MKRRIKNTLITLICSVILGTLLLVGIFCLPVESAREHVRESLYDMIEIRDDEAGNPFRKWIVECKENFTDALMVQNALEKVEGKNPLEQAMYVYHYDLQDEAETTWLTEESLVTFLQEGSEGLHLREYSKYWHGYLVVLKPLLMCMSWKQMEIFLVIVQILLMFSVIALSFYQRKPYVGLGVLYAFLFMKPVRIWVSLAMCVCWNITLLAVLAELLFYEKLEKRNLWEEIFLIIGILTAYMDFLTYPIVTLGIPLCIYLIMHLDTHMKFWKKLLQAFWICACWAVGYIGMWGMKWVVAELTCKTGTLRNAVWSIISRTEPLDGYGSVFTGSYRTLQAVLQQYDSVFYRIAFWILAAVTVIAVVWCLMKARDKEWGMTIFCLGIVALFPFVWLFLTQNHTAIHCIFTFRIMGVSIMALWSILICSVFTIRRKGVANEK